VLLFAERRILPEDAALYPRKLGGSHETQHSACHDFSVRHRDGGLGQAIGPIGGFSSGITSGSFGSGVLSGAGAVVTGFGVQVSADSGSRIGPVSDPFAARDGCTNIPNQAHNSADCSRIVAWDPSWALPDKSVTT